MGGQPHSEAEKPYDTSLEDNISMKKAWILESLDNKDYMILDREVIDVNTFETVRKATEDEITWFYEIRLSQLKIKELENSLPR